MDVADMLLKDLHFSLKKKRQILVYPGNLYDKN